MAAASRSTRRSSSVPRPEHAFRDFVPTRSLLILLTGVFLTFSAMGFALDLFGLSPQPALARGLRVALWSVFGTAAALLTLRFRHRYKLLYPPLLVMWLVAAMALPVVFPPEPVPRPMETADIMALRIRMILNGAGIMASINLAYLCFFWFVKTEAKRYYHYRAEIALAGEIHRLLVPPLELTVDGVEIRAESQASNEVGGDLVDVVSSADGWLAYVADVSGHGVAPGVVMGMVKSAVRTRLSGPANTQPLLDHLNHVIHPLKKSNMFVTFAYVAGRGDEVELATAGHPPILHYAARDKRVSERRCANLPLGVRPHERFATTRVTWEPGDLLVVVTDGLLEQEDAAGKELGITGLERVVEQHGGGPLAELSRRILDAVNRHGPRQDDQSLLLIRRRGNATA